MSDPTFSSECVRTVDRIVSAYERELYRVLSLDFTGDPMTPDDAKRAAIALAESRPNYLEKI